MRRRALPLTVIASLLSAPALAQTAEEPPVQSEGELEQKIDRFADEADRALNALQLMLRALRERAPEIEQEFRETLPEIERQLDAIGPQVEDAFRSLAPMLGDALPDYEAPVILPNGDILIRRKHPLIPQEREIET